MTKEDCRCILKGIWDEMEEQHLADLSRKVCQRILGSKEWEDASVILAYLSFRKELSLDQLIKESLDAGKKVAVPLIENRTEMTFRLLRGWPPENMILNRWGIREPREDAPLLEKGGAGLILLPGLGFSKDGRRMGRGGGYYDRYLHAADLNGSLLMGICCDECLSGTIPVEEHDIPVHAVCTESRIIHP